MENDLYTVISAEWLFANFSRPDIVVLDSSWHMPSADRDPYAEFLDAHIPGSRFLDIDVVCDGDTDLPHMLPSAEEFAAAASLLGVTNRSLVIAYDTVGLFSAARAWWMFRAMGHNNVAVLDGGLPAWKAAGGDIASGPAVSPTATFRARTMGNANVDLAQMREVVEGRRHVILDARPAGRFNGTDPEPRPGLPSGHMPGAVSLPFPTVLTEDGTLKSADDLAEIFRDLDVVSGDGIVTSCGSGVTAAILSLALEHAGITGTALYDGSWTQWASTPGVPIETT